MAILVSVGLAAGSWWLETGSAVGQGALDRQVQRVLDAAKSRLTETQYEAAAGRIGGLRLPPWKIARSKAVGLLWQTILWAVAFRVVLGIVFATSAVRLREVMRVLAYASLVAALGEAASSLATYLNNGDLVRLGAIGNLVPGSWPGFIRAYGEVLNVVTLLWLGVVGSGLAVLYGTSTKAMNVGLLLAYVMALVILAYLRGINIPVHGL